MTEFTVTVKRTKTSIIEETVIAEDFAQAERIISLKYPKKEIISIEEPENHSPRFFGMDEVPEEEDLI